MGGLDMMVNQMLKNIGLDPKQIGELAESFQNAIINIQRQNDTILKQQRRIMRQLEIPFEEENNGNGNGSEHGDGDGGAGSGSVAA